MDVYRPLRAGLFIYEILRFLLLVVFLSLDGGFLSDNLRSGGFFPYDVYLSSNALFPLMALFLLLNPREYRSYLTLYMAGKIIGVVSFYVWEVFSTRNLPGGMNLLSNIIFLGGSVFISLMDILSLWGAWMLKNKWKKLSEPKDPQDPQNPIDPMGPALTGSDNGGQ